MKLSGKAKGSDRMRPRNQRVIYTDRLRENMEKIRNAVPPDVKILAVVKADGYGHGAVETSRAALEGGAEMLAVASVAEGSKLRKNGITAPILVLGAVTAADVKEGIELDLIQTVCSEDMVHLCENAAVSLHKQTKVHLKIDTGMGRIGVRTEDELKKVYDAIQNAAHVSLTGAFTHFSDADDGDEGMQYTESQYSRFLQLTSFLPKGIILHCSNSAAIHRRPDFAMNMVRAGISLYGYPPVPERNLHLQPCMRWTAKISYIKELPAGEYISYGRTYQTSSPMRVATVTCGYADGYHRCASGKATVLIHGKRAPILGRICMDQMIADVTHIPEAVPEDEVILMGEAQEDQITAEDIASWAGTISYEILLSVGSRVDRVFESIERKQGGTY